VTYAGSLAELASATMSFRDGERRQELDKKGGEKNLVNKPDRRGTHQKCLHTKSLRKAH
jgi:hypothetical protein